MKKGVTIKDIAKRLNMSVSTVSKALNDNPLISALTKERVKKLAKEWNYIPNEAARHFKQSKSYTLGVIVPDLLDQFYVLAVNGIEKVASKKNYNVIVSQTHEDADIEEKLIENMIKNRVDGAIITVSKNTKNVERFQRLAYAGIPFVFFARYFSEQEYDYVSTDNVGGAKKAVEYLLKRGHKRIAHLMGPSFLKTSIQRYNGYLDALMKYKVSFDPALVEEVDLSPEQTYAAVRRLMQLDNPPTAFFTFKNYISLDVIKILKQEFSQQLEKTEVVGFGNLPLIQYLDYKPIAAIDENSFRMGEKAAELIFENIEHNDKELEEERPAQHMRIPCRLIMY
ncbi:LacI family DNA-binding transcriptional regulator [Niabella digestorum]|uniref:LacI family DNA-binding transcriptional regulator n=1 Tax=Niabella digestorum TaxID=3117701 RepID=A0ABU7RF55_9BACT